MSTIVRNKGSIEEVCVKEILDRGLDPYDLYDTEYRRIGGRYFKIRFEVEAEIDCSSFADIEKCPYSTVDTYYFHTLHYNGGCSLEEILEDLIHE